MLDLLEEAEAMQMVEAEPSAVDPGGVSEAETLVEPGTRASEISEMLSPSGASPVTELEENEKDKDDKDLLEGEGEEGEEDVGKDLVAAGGGAAAVRAVRAASLEDISD